MDEVVEEGVVGCRDKAGLEKHSFANLMNAIDPYDLA